MILTNKNKCLAAGLLLLAACGGQPAPGGASAPAVAPARDAEVISREELLDPAMTGHDAMYAVQQLRPTFLRTRGSSSIPATTGATTAAAAAQQRQTDAQNATGAVRVSSDYGPPQPLTALNGVDVKNLNEIRYLNVIAAQSRFGVSANGGPVIVLISYKK